MDLAAFFDSIRPLFGGSLTQQQVDGCEAILAVSDGLHITQRAYMLATAYHETAFTMQPITEYGARSYFNKYEPGTRIGRVLGNTEPGDGYRFRGRGYVQLTGRRNYALASRQLGVDLIGNPDGALSPTVAGRIMRTGMRDGWFTGKALKDYLPGDYVNARRIINGTDRARAIAGHAEAFEAAIAAGRGGVAVTQPPKPAASPWAALWAFFADAFRAAK